MTRLAHVNIRSSDLGRSVAFYRDVLNLTAGPAATRPDSEDHVWMSDEDGSPCIHLQRTLAGAAEAGECTGVHHVALACEALEDWRAKLTMMRIAYREAEFPGANMVQLNLLDPDGVRLELLFQAGQ